MGSRFLPWLAGMAALCFLTSLAISEERGIHIGPPEAPDAKSFWALIIGIEEYHHWPRLTTAVNDAKALRRVLIDQYGFPEEQVFTLINDQATRRNILSALRTLGKRIRKGRDSLLIYYAGHGQLDDLLQTGYWIPVDAQQHAVADIIDNTVILNYIQAIDTLHTLLIADSCFAGSLFLRGPTQAPEEADEAYFKRVYGLKSRQGITSGNVRPLADTGLASHSIFAHHFIKALDENPEPYLVPSTVFERIKIPLARNSAQIPTFKPLKDARDEGGEFVFVLRRPAARVPPEAEVPSISPSREAKADLHAEIRALEMKRRKLQEEVRVLQEERKRFQERHELEEERSQLEALRKELEQPVSLVPSVKPDRAGLLWMEVPKLFTWKEALREAHRLSGRDAGHGHGWHIPSRDEARSLLASRKGKEGEALTCIKGTYWIDELEEHSTSGLGAIQEYATYFDIEEGQFLKSDETLNPQAHKLILVRSGTQRNGPGSGETP